MKTLALAALVFAASAAAADKPLQPSRPAFEKCAWEPFSDPALGLETLVMRCDYGDRKIDFVRAGDALAIRYSDGGGKPDPLIEVIAREPNEAPKDAILRTFKAHTDAKLAARCTLAPYQGDRPPAGVTRFTFVPDAAYAKELAKTARDDEVGDPPCGDWGDAPDGIQYFEVPANADARAVLFVRIGQDEPLFDEKRLRVLPR
jgi:hypothetical protein